MNIYQDISYLYINKCRNEINVESNYAALKRYLTYMNFHMVFAQLMSIEWINELRI